MAMESIEELFEHELKDILGGEHALVDALEQMAQESSDRDIRKAYTQHRKETQGQIKRIEKIFRSLGQKPEAESCPGVEGLIKEKKVFMREKPTGELLEFFNVGAAQKVERYEITSYESGFKLELEAFHDAVVTGKAPLTGAEDAIHDLALCEAIIRFVQDRQPIADPSAISALASTN